MENRYLIKIKKTECLIKYAYKAFGVPVFKSCLVVYSTDGIYTFELIFRNNKPSFRFYENKETVMDLEHDESLLNFPYIEIPEEKLRFFLIMISKFGFNKANINLSERIEFAKNGNNILTIQRKTLIGDILYLDESIENNIRKAIIKKFCKIFLDKQTINEIIKKKEIEEDLIYSDGGIINSKISSFANIQGINLSNAPSSIALKLGAKSNDFSIFDNIFEILFKRKITSQNVCDRSLDESIPNASIIIPCFKSEKTIEKVLESINSQDLELKNFERIEVIIIDDGSETPVSNIINLKDKKYRFDVRIVRLERNSGLSFARNIGLHVSKYENLIFIDSDILLEKNYLREHLLRIQIVPNAIFFSLKKNINNRSISLNKIKSGLCKPITFDDKRLHKKFKSRALWINEIRLNGDFEILNETDNLKLFGNGRTINGFDLPSTVIGHNLTIKKSVLNKVGGFNNSFKGWGLEDTFLGAKIISEGNFIIPVLSTGVYHINHSPRSGTEKNKENEYIKNLKIYKELIYKES